MFEIGIMIVAGTLFVLATNLYSVPLERSFLSRPILGLVLGFCLGPGRVAWIMPSEWFLPYHDVLMHVTKLTLVISLMGVALRLPPSYFKHHLKPMVVVLGLGMLGMWLITSTIVYLTLGVSLLVAALIGAILTPTDPVLATVIVEGRVAQERLPVRLRNLISAESGANDGLALPFVMLPTLLLTQSKVTAFHDWLSNVLVWQTIGAIIIGWLLGTGTGKMLSYGERKKWIETPAMLATTLTLSVLVFGIGELIQINSILAAFTAGIGFDSGAKYSEREEAENVQEAINKFLTLPIFMIFGFNLPIQEWRNLGLIAIFTTILILLLRRLPVWFVIKSQVKPLKDYKEAAFTGWFGPIGVAALYYAVHARKMTGDENIWIFASMVISASIVIHGLTAAYLTGWMRKDEPR